MFGARVDMLRRDPEDGSIFLDRSGERFGLVLDFLRDGGASQLAKTIREMPTEQHEAMLLELSFFGLADAVFPPRPWTIEDAEFRTWGGELNSMRMWCAAVLHGRRVVVFGGDAGIAAVSTTEVLDLDDTGTTEASFTAGPTMATARQGCAAVRLDARRVLVVGGTDEYNSYARSLNTTEVLDLETMRFSAGPTMLSKRYECSAVALDARRILVVGGCDESVSTLKTTEILDVATMTFAPGPDMLSARYGCSAVALLENPRRALIVGGCDGTGSLNTTEVLDLDTMAFSHGPTMRTARWGCAAVLLGGGDSRRRCLVVIGGSDDDDLEVNTTEVLDLETMEFTEGPVMLAEREGCAAVADDTGDRVFVLGGSTGMDPSAGVEVLEAAAAQEVTRATRRRR
jgi:hypothetical protein